MNPIVIDLIKVAVFIYVALVVSGFLFTQFSDFLGAVSAISFASYAIWYLALA